jgi:hypothetical protein
MVTGLQADADNYAAAAAYRLSVKAGNPLSERKLAASGLALSRLRSSLRGSRGGGGWQTHAMTVAGERRCRGGIRLEYATTDWNIAGIVILAIAAASALWAGALPSAKACAIRR